MAEKSYKLVGEDEHLFHIEHPDGSQFSIAKQAIGPGVHEHIKSLKLADGGEVPDAKESSDNKEEKTYGLEDMKQGINDIGDWFKSGLQEPPAPASETPPVGTSVDSYANQASSIPAPEPEAQRAPSSDAIQAPAAAQPGAAQAPIQQPSQNAPAANPSPGPASDWMNAQNNAINQQKQANTEMGQAQSSGLAQQANLYENEAKQIKEVEDKYAPIEAGLQQKNQALQQAIMDQKIDHNRVWANMGTGNKIAAAISVLFSGLGSGLTGKPNMAMDVIQKTIDRDVEDQKMELGKKQNLFSENLRQLGDIRAAKSATKADLITAAQAQANSIAAQSGSQEALAKVKVLNSAADLEKAKLNREATLFKMMQNESGTNPTGMMSYLRMYDPPKAKEMEARYVPGVGIGSVPIPDEARQKLIAKQSLDERAQDLYSWASKHSGEVNPTIVNQGKTKAAELQNMYRASMNGGVFKPGEQSFIEGIVNSDPTAFFNKVRVLPALKSVIDSNRSQLNTLKQGYGLPQQKYEKELSPRMLNDGSGKIGLFDPDTKNFVRYK